jgi:hypothetical protein
MLIHTRSLLEHQVMRTKGGLRYTLVSNDTTFGQHSENEHVCYSYELSELEIVP